MQKHRGDIGKRASALGAQNHAWGSGIFHKEWPEIITIGKYPELNYFKVENEAVYDDQQDSRYGKERVPIRFCIIQRNHNLDLQWHGRNFKILQTIQGIKN